ncbi:MAG: MFS transporter [Gammaproteobacteria bacterium]|nr:MAG: MFS transporter [Gammaproteobacteria bacterium]
MDGTSKRLTPSQRVGYAIGDLGINLYFISTGTYLLYFYTDVFGISAAVAASVLLVARVVDAVTDPLMGMIAERTQSRWGRLRPYVLFGAIPLGAVSVLMFTTPDLSNEGKIWWAYTTYILFGILYTVVGIPYSALTSSLTSNHHERTLLSTIRMAFAFGGGYAISVGMLPLVGFFETAQTGFQMVMIGFSVAATLLLWITFASTEERVQPPPSQKLTISDSFAAVFRNPPLLVVMALFTGGMLSFTVRQTVTVYYLKYNVGREDLVSVFFGITMPVMFLGLLAVPKLAARFGKAGGIMVGASVTIVGCVGLYFTPYDSIVGIFFFSAVMALGGTPIAVLGWAMIPDTVEYAQWKLGLRADGAIFSFSSFFQKLAKAIGGAGVAAALAAVGYVANAEQTEVSLNAIHLMMTITPAVIMAFVILIASFYRLDEATHSAMVAEIEARG